MASVTRKDDEKLMANDQESDEEDLERDQQQRPDRKQPPPRPVDYEPARAPGFFTLYKSGQGYWTRLGTGIAAGLILALFLHFLWSYMPSMIRMWIVPANATTEQSAAANATAQKITIGICVAAALGMGLLTWHLINKPSNVDFLIATDSEMKKVNWTSRKDLIGSTKVVILFMFMIAAFLFVCDLFFGYVFYFLGVLETPPL